MSLVPSEAIKFLARLCILAPALGLPWLFGGVYAGHLSPAFLLAVSGLLVFAVYLLFRPSSIALPWKALAPLMLAIGLGAVQLVPLPRSVVSVISPEAVSFHDRFAGAIPPDAAQAGGDDRLTLSVYPGATKLDIAILIWGFIGLAAGVLLFRQDTAFLILCFGVALNGAGLAFFGLVQKLTWNGLLYWYYPLTYGGVPFGPFINRNNAAGFLNLCIAGAIGALFWNLISPVPERVTCVPHPDGRLRREWRSIMDSFQGRISGPAVTAAVLAAFAVAGVLSSLSRGGSGALLGGGILVLILLRRKVAWWSAALVLAAALGLVTWVGMFEEVDARLKELTDQQAFTTDVRLTNWSEGARAAGRFWLCGSGLGTYGYVYRPYQLRNTDIWHRYPENEYLEAFSHGGVLGCVLLLISIAVLAAAVFELLRYGGRRDRVFGVVGVFLVASQLLQGLVDFGWRTPANTFLLAIICGAIIGRAQTLKQKSTAVVSRGARFVTSFCFVVFIACVGSWGWSELNRYDPIQRQLRTTTRISDSLDSVSSERLEQMIAELSLAVAARDDDAEGHLRLAELWRHFYRLRAFAELKQEYGDELGANELWQATSPVRLHQLAAELALRNEADELTEWRRQPLFESSLMKSRQHFLAARKACPLLADSHLQLAMLEFLVADPLTDSEHVERAHGLAPNNVRMLLALGQLDFNSGRRSAAYEKWRHAWSLVPARGSEFWKTFSGQVPEADLLQHVVPEHPEVLIAVARDHLGGPAQSEARKAVIERASKLLEASTPGPQRDSLLGATSALQGDYAQSIIHYRRAIALRPDNLAWRYEAASALYELGRIDEAGDELQWCLWSDPNNPRYQALRERLNGGANRPR